MRKLLFRPSVAVLTLVCFGVLTSGCAQIIRGSSASVTINSAPAGATVSSTSGAACQTPCMLSLSRKQMHSLTINLPGYQPAHVQLISELSWGWLIIDVVLVGLFAVISWAGGGLYNLEPESVFVTLMPLADNGETKPMVVEFYCSPSDEGASCNINKRPELDAVIN